MAQLTAAIETKVASIIAADGISVRGGTIATYAEMPLSAGDVDEDDWVHDESCMRLAWIASQQHLKGISVQGSVRLTESRMSQFASGAGDKICAEAQTLHRDAKGARLRVQIYRLPADQNIAEHYLIADFSAVGVFIGTLSVGEGVAELVDARSQRTSNEPVALTNRERTMEAKRRQVFDGACEVIGREGYAATTMRKVAKAAGLPLSSIYQYIDTKEDLLYMITSTCMEEIFEYMHEELLAVGTAEEKMQHAVEAYVKYISKNRRYINLVYRETRALSRPNREKIFDIERRFTQLWEKIIIEGNDSGEFEAHKSRLAANLIYFVCNLWSLRYWTVQEYTEDEVREYLQRFVISGLKSAEN